MGCIKDDIYIASYQALRYYQMVGMAGGKYANLISAWWRCGAEEAIHVTLVWKWMWSGRAREHYTSIISDRKCP